jgi:hypothetical protein
MAGPNRRNKVLVVIMRDADTRGLATKLQAMADAPDSRRLKDALVVETADAESFRRISSMAVAVKAVP